MIGKVPENNPPVSIVVPIYNVEKYLKPCVDSILSQTFSDFELILVDDESPDNCGQICDEYARKDMRVRVIHKKNGGLSDARNAGIQAARTKYIGFIDSDDYIESSMLEVLYKLVTETGADFSCCGIMNCYSDYKTPQFDKEETLVVDSKLAYRLMMEGKKIPGSSCGKLYKREIFDTYLFPKGKKYEDAFLFSDVLPAVHTVAVSTKPLYNYVHREGSYTTTFKDKEFDIIEAYEKNLETVRRCFPELTEQGLFRYYWAHFVVLDHMLQAENYRSFSGYHEIVSLLKKHTFEIAGNPYFNKTRRLSALCLFLSVRLYRVLAIQNNKKNAKLN